MLGLGSGEILLVLFLAFLLFGPEELPELAFRMGRFFREVRRSYQDAVESFTRGLEEWDVDTSSSEPEASVSDRRDAG